jgi:putative redox protein
MIVSKVTYTGGLRTSMVHLRSGNTVITDAPVDNNGRGAAFSPTDTVASALAACMLTMMGIAAESKGWNLEGSWAEVTKIMGTHPRRITGIEISMTVMDRQLDDKARQILEHTARTCPVWQSLHPDIAITLHLAFEAC